MLSSSGCYCSHDLIIGNLSSGHAELLQSWSSGHGPAGLRTIISLSSPEYRNLDRLSRVVKQTMLALENMTSRSCGKAWPRMFPVAFKLSALMTHTI